MPDHTRSIHRSRRVQSAASRQMKHAYSPVTATPDRARPPTRSRPCMSPPCDALPETPYSIFQPPKNPRNPKHHYSGLLACKTATDLIPHHHDLPRPCSNHEINAYPPIGPILPLVHPPASGMVECTSACTSNQETSPSSSISCRARKYCRVTAEPPRARPLPFPDPGPCMRKSLSPVSRQLLRDASR